MKNKQIYQNNAVLYAIGCMGALLMIAPFFNRHYKKEETRQNPPTATVVQHHTDTNNAAHPTTQLWLDIDGNETPDALCEFTLDDIKPLSDKELQQIMPVGTTRTIWEWKRLGHYSKFEQR